MRLIHDKITIEELKKMQYGLLGLYVKAVADIKKNIMAVDGLLHIEEKNLLREQGSADEDLWSINLYPEKYPDESWIEYTTFLNMTIKACISKIPTYEKKLKSLSAH